mmetsp:Transcript_48455/g.139346  ORF Transcript_48455/g.139346 Transcript_48455/m.139346 type:complete len:308 (-) Transcript_48455:302-1225(-)
MPAASRMLAPVLLCFSLRFAAVSAARKAGSGAHERRIAVSATGPDGEARKAAVTHSWGEEHFHPNLVATEMLGDLGTHEYRRFFKDAKTNNFISPWHDIPLDTSKETPTEKWMVTEIVKLTSAKYEIHTEERFNPIAQDVKNGDLRHYHGPIFWNYGFFPQTWEDPTEVHPELNVKGDNDPLDVVEIGSRAFKKGEVVRVKILGALAMIDHGELDWKVIAVSVEDELARELDDVHDLEAKIPHVVNGIREWFRWYKAPDGKLNEFGFGGHALSREKALEVVEETHRAWRRLYDGEIKHGALWVGDDA